jgi:GntR family glv operon transcriptional regulator
LLTGEENNLALSCTRGLLVIYKSIADRLRLRLNSADFAIGSPLPGEKNWPRSSGWRA